MGKEKPRKKARVKYEAGWTTHDELRFLRRIGKHANRSMFVPKLELLFRYEKGLNRRKKWGKINEVAIRACLLEMMK